MKYAEYAIPYDHAYLLIISDCHIGEKGFGIRARELLQDNIKWVQETPNARVVLNGDILSCATRTSATSPSDQYMNLSDQVEYATKIFEPIKDKIVAAHDGNHERRLHDYCGYSPLTAMCVALNIPYHGISSVIKFIVGNRRPKRALPVGCVIYHGYFHHTTGGGSTVGGKMNRVDKLRRIVADADFYAGSHNHQLGVIPVETSVIDPNRKGVVKIRQLLIDTGSYLEWENSYAEANMYEPSKLGSPRIRLDGTRKDIHASV